MDRDPRAPVRKGPYEPLTETEHRENMVHFKAPAERAAGDRLNKGAAKDDRLLGTAERREAERNEIADRPPPNSADVPGATT
jgi:hypothetical protein